MVNRSALAALALAGLLLLAGCTGIASQPADDPASNVTVNLDEGTDGATVSVGGRDTVTAEPDAATVRLQVVAEGDDPEAVRNDLSRNASAVRQALLDYGLAEDQVRSDQFRIRENYRARRHPERDLPTYRGAHELVVELDDPDAVGDVIDAAVESGPVRVEGVQFGLSDERRAELREQALTGAVEDARSEAELVASAEDLALESALSISTDRVNVERPEATVYREAAAEPTEAPDSTANTRVEAGEVTVRASVTVVYNASTS